MRDATGPGVPALVDSPVFGQGRARGVLVAGPGVGPNFEECMTTIVRWADSIICAIIWASCRLVMVNPALAETSPTPMTATSALMPSVPGKDTGPIVTWGGQAAAAAQEVDVADRAGRQGRGDAEVVGDDGEVPPDAERVRDRLGGGAAAEDDGLAVGDPLGGRGRDALILFAVHR